ncbi:MAG: hypothetical protein ACYC18_05655 [Gammaproteobacteria bacterium]|nr:hypothetical protein [Gammaproteobacteria bacterium]
MSRSRAWRVACLATAVVIAAPGVANADRDRRDRDGRTWRGDIRHFGHHDLRIWRGGHWYHGPYEGRFGWWWVVGSFWYFYPQPVYPYPNPYVPPVVAVPPAAATSSAPPVEYWYYCGPRRAYYPYVRNCPEPWRLVPATPAP